MTQVFVVVLVLRLSSASVLILKRDTSAYLVATRWLVRHVRRGFMWDMAMWDMALCETWLCVTWLYVRHGLIRDVHTNTLTFSPPHPAFVEERMQLELVWNTNPKQNEAQSARAESTHKGGNQRSKDVTQAQQQRPESPAATLTPHACKCEVRKLHQSYSLKKGCRPVAYIVWNRTRPRAPVQNTQGSYLALERRHTSTTLALRTRVNYKVHKLHQKYILKKKKRMPPSWF